MTAAAGTLSVRGCKKAVDESSPQHVITHEMTTALQGGGKGERDKERERE